jgi:hypothetical protein
MTKMIREPTSSVSRARSPPFAAALCPGPSAGSYQAATRPNNPYKALAMMELWIGRSLLFPMVAPDPVFFFFAHGSLLGEKLFAARAWGTGAIGCGGRTVWIGLHERFVPLHSLAHPFECSCTGSCSIEVCVT